MASKEDYERIKNLTGSEIIEIAKHCCGDIIDETIEVNIDDTYNDNDELGFCGSKCPYLDVREGEINPNRWCRQWLMHDLLRIIKEN